NQSGLVGRRRVFQGRTRVHPLQWNRVRGSQSSLRSADRGRGYCARTPGQTDTRKFASPDDRKRGGDSLGKSSPGSGAWGDKPGRSHAAGAGIVGVTVSVMAGCPVRKRAAFHGSRGGYGIGRHFFVLTL